MTRHGHTLLKTTVLRYDRSTDTETEVSVEFDYYPGTETVYYRRNGDPGEPGDPPEVVVLDARLPDGSETVLTQDEEADLYVEALGLLEDLREDAADYLYECRRDG